MRLAHSDEQRAFAEALDRLLGGADVVAAARGWAGGDTGPGLALWGRVAEVGLPALLVPEEHDGLGGSAVDVSIGLERIGWHGVPGPWVETVAAAPVLLSALGRGDDLTAVAAGELRVAVADDGWLVDADVCGLALAADGHRIHRARAGETRSSVDGTRRLNLAVLEESLGEVAPAVVARATDLAALGTSAVLLGAGRRLLHDAVEYAKSRKQFGRVIGEYQALKHQLADAHVGLEFAGPLVHGAAVAIAGEAPEAGRSTSAAAVACAEAAHRAARTALQVHGAIGYTRELDLSLWLTRVQALRSAWGTPSYHRGRLLASLQEA